MADIRREPALFYLDTGRGYYLAGPTLNALQLDIPTDVISDLELVSKERLSLLIKGFVEANQLPPANVHILLSPTMTFDKDLPEGLPAEIEGETKSFLNFVPFEEMYSKPIKLGKKIKIVSANKDICDSIKTAFEDLQFSVATIVPLSVLQETMQELASNLDLALILSRADGIRQYSLLSSEVSVSSNLTIKPQQNHQSNSRQLILIVVFAVLLIVLGFVVYTNLIAPSSQTPTASLTPTAVPTRAAQPVSESGTESAGVKAQQSIAPTRIPTIIK